MVSRATHKKRIFIAVEPQLIYAIQLSISLPHAWIWATAAACASPLWESKDMYNWESSALRFKPMLYPRTISPSGEVCDRYNMGPKTEPWGTPQHNGLAWKPLPLDIDKLVCITKIWSKPEESRTNYTKARWQPIKQDIIIDCVESSR